MNKRANRYLEKVIKDHYFFYYLSWKW